MNKQFIMVEIVTVLMSFVCPMTSWAQEYVRIDEVWYECYSYEDSTYAVVSGYDSEKLLGDLVIPSSVSCNGKEYPVTEISYGAFSGCSSLSSVVIPEGVVAIRDGAFYSCSSLSSVVIPEGVATIGDGAFSGCSSLSSVVIPEGVVTIGDGAFYGCTSLLLN